MPLNLLGFPCYHMLVNMENKDSLFWVKVANGEEVDFAEVYGRGDNEAEWYTASVEQEASLSKHWLFLAKIRDPKGIRRLPRQG